VARGSRVAASAPVFSVEAVPEQQGLREAEARADSARQKAQNLSEPRRPSEVAAIEAQLRAAQAALALSTRQVEQAEALAASKFVSDARVDEARAAKARDAAQVEAVRQELATTRITVGREAEVRAAQAEAEAAVAQVAQKKWQVDRKLVTAPLAGEITEIYYRPGEWVAAGAPVASLLPDARRRLRFFVPETAIATLRPGQTVEARCDGCAKPIRATIDFIAPHIDVRGLNKHFGAKHVVKDFTAGARAARSWDSSDPTAAARRPRSACCAACSRPDAAEAAPASVST
jgi:HlyD family secretion protein